jgi:oligoribonuclease NrnB/cAMP/cGMP phosphodiesterase (DHH superfamily)
MDDSLIDDDTLSLSRKSVLPGEGFFYPDSLDEQRAEQEVRTALAGTDIAVVADPDADGLACVALIEAAVGGRTDGQRRTNERGVETGEQASAPLGESDERTSTSASASARDDEAEIRREGGDRSDAGGTDGGVALIGAGPYDLPDALARVGAHAEPGTQVYVCDLCPDDESDLVALETLVERGAVRWFDHHQWDDGVAEAVRESGVDLVVGDSEAECSADVTLRSLDVEFDERYEELAAVTRDHDLWLREDSRSDDLADLAYWLDADEYVEVVLEHGADLPAEATDYLAERRVEKAALIERATERAEFTDVGPWTVGVTYGRCSQNEVAQNLREQGADASVIIKPAGSASIRGTDAFARCHEVARQVSGGGHPKAAGCKPDIYDDMLDYAHHWSTQGAATKRVILAAFERLVNEADGRGNEANDEGDETSGEATRT